MAYKYLNVARINSTIKKHNLQVVKGEGYFYFLDLKTGNQVGESVMVAKLHHLSIQQWRDTAAAARGSVADGYAEAEAAHKAASTADAEVRALVESLDETPVETWDQAVEATERERATA